MPITKLKGEIKGEGQAEVEFHAHYESYAKFCSQCQGHSQYWCQVQD